MSILTCIIINTILLTLDWREQCVSEQQKASSQHTDWWTAYKSACSSQI